MAILQDPTVLRRRLRVELRRAREAAGQKQSDVAAAMDWSPSKLIRIENGAVGISTNDLRVLLGHYGIRDKRRVDTLLELARGSRERSWYDKYGDVLTSGYREYLAYEASAAVIRQFEPLMVPGLLQTEEYALALLSGAYGSGDEDAELLWQVRQQRQELHERPEPPDMSFVLDEASVRRWVGGPRVMRRQLDRLKELAALEHVTVQIVPLAAGAHPGMTGAFVLLEFAEPDLDDLVHLEGQGSATLRDNPEETARHLEVFEDLEGHALEPEESIALVDTLIAEMTQDKPREVVGQAS